MALGVLTWCVGGSERSLELSPTFALVVTEMHPHRIIRRGQFVDHAP